MAVGQIIIPICGIPVFEDIYMDIESSPYEPGVIWYSLYYYNGAERETVNSSEVARRLGHKVIVAGIVVGLIIGATIVEDFLSSGAGVLDDIASLFGAIGAAEMILDH